MKKLILGVATVIALMLTVQVNAQQNVGSAGIELALPMGDFADFANFGYGVSAQYEFGLTDNIALNLNAGVLLYAIEMDGMNYTQIPIQLGGRYYLSEQKEGLFLGVKAGMHLNMVSIDDAEDGSESEANFSFAPEVGYFVTENISLALKYQIITASEDEASNLSYLGLRAAYNF